MTTQLPLGASGSAWKAAKRVPSAASSTTSSCEAAAPRTTGIGGAESRSKHTSARRYRPAALVLTGEADDLQAVGVVLPDRAGGVRIARGRAGRASRNPRVDEEALDRVLRVVGDDEPGESGHGHGAGPTREAADHGDHDEVDVRRGVQARDAVLAGREQRVG